MNDTNGGRTEVADARDLGAVLRERRAAHELTQDEVAKALGVHRRYVYELERGSPDLRLQRTIEALRLVGVNVRLEVEGKPVALPARKQRSRKHTRSADDGGAQEATPRQVVDEEPRPRRRRWFGR